MPKNTARQEKVNRKINELKQYLVRNPNDGNALYELAKAYNLINQVGLALSYICQAIGTDGKSPAYYCELGKYFIRLGKPLEANCAFRQALSLDNNFADAYHGLGLALKAAGDLDLSLGAIKKAVEISPKNPEFFSDLASVYSETRDYVRAYRAAKAAYSLRDGFNYGAVWVFEALVGQGKMIQAIDWLQQCLRKKPTWENGYHNMGRINLALGRYKTAQSYFKKTVAMHPEHADAYFGLAASLLGNGEFIEGWKQYEWRFKLGNASRSVVGKFVAELTEPPWNGESLKDKTLLVYGEQGFGDTIQSLRFLSVLTKQGCKIILMIYKEIFKLLKPLADGITVIAYGDLIPRYDYHIALFSLPFMLKTTLNTIPNDVPYIPVPRLCRLPSQLLVSGKLRVGFVWSTTRISAGDHRSIQINYFDPLFAIDTIEYYSLQINQWSKELEPFMRQYSNVHSLKKYIRDWSDTARFILEMDIIISIDSGIAHLSGALGKPIWVILSKTADWRWLSGEKSSPWNFKSPWYPTMRLFRSPSYHSWKAVVRQVKEELLATKKP